MHQRRPVNLVVFLLERLTRAQRGRYAERLVRGVYSLRGFQSLHLDGMPAQVDLIMARGSLVVLVEVKYRTDDLRRLHAVHPHQRQRLERAARALNRRYPKAALRADLALLGPRWPFLRLHANAWPLGQI